MDSIHTDGTPTLNVGLGIFQSVGHVDYYPNGGINQPNCPQTSDKILTNWPKTSVQSLKCIEGAVASCSYNVARLGGVGLGLTGKLAL